MSERILDIGSQIGTNGDQPLYQVSVGQIRSIVKAARTIPSADNCQPFSYRWDGQYLTITNNPKKTKHELNNNEHPTMVTLGSAIEAINIASSAFGLRSYVQLSVSQPTCVQAWAKISFDQKNIKRSELVEAIDLRSTDRRVYDGGNLEDPCFDKVLEINNSTLYCRIHLNKVTKRLSKIIFRSDEFFWTNSHLVEQLLNLVRLTGTERKAHKDGMSAKDLGLNFIDSLFFRLIRKFPAIPKKMWNLGFKLMISNITKSWLKSSAGLMIFSLREITTETLVELGRISYRSWLVLNQHGYSVHPLSACSLPIIDYKTGFLKSEEDQKMFSDCENVIRKEVNIANGETPVWVFRVGRSPARKGPKKMSVKPSVDDILKIDLPKV